MPRVPAPVPVLLAAPQRGEASACCHTACVLPCTPEPGELEMKLPLDRRFSSMDRVYQEGFINLAEVRAEKGAFGTA